MYCTFGEADNVDIIRSNVSLLHCLVHDLEDAIAVVLCGVARKKTLAWWCNVCVSYIRQYIDLPSLVSYYSNTKLICRSFESDCYRHFQKEEKSVKRTCC